jgi:hypothetical protein
LLLQPHRSLQQRDDSNEHQNAERPGDDAAINHKLIDCRTVQQEEPVRAHPQI